MNARDSVLRTPLHYASINSNADSQLILTYKVLRELGVDFNAVDEVELRNTENFREEIPHYMKPQKICMKYLRNYWIM